MFNPGTLFSHTPPKYAIIGDTLYSSGAVGTYVSRESNTPTLWKTGIEVTANTTGNEGVIRYNGSEFLAIGASDESDGPMTFWSKDGKAWERRGDLGVSFGRIRGLVWDGSRWVCVINAKTYASVDSGESWSVLMAGNISASSINSFLWDGTNYLATTSSNAYYSTDAVNWTTSALLSSGFVASLYDGTAWILGGSNNTNTIIRSTDLSSWTAVHASATFDVSALTFGGGVYVAAGSISSVPNILRSTDGITWAAATSVPVYSFGTFLDWVHWDGALFFAGGRNQSQEFYDIIVSADGNTWTTVTPSPVRWTASAQMTSITGPSTGREG